MSRHLWHCGQDNRGNTAMWDNPWLLWCVCRSVFEQDAEPSVVLRWAITVWMLDMKTNGKNCCITFTDRVWSPVYWDTNPQQWPYRSSLYWFWWFLVLVYTNVPLKMVILTLRAGNTFYYKWWKHWRRGWQGLCFATLFPVSFFCPFLKITRCHFWHSPFYCFLLVSPCFCSPVSTSWLKEGFMKEPSIMTI